jgi:hypothetical protein
MGAVLALRFTVTNNGSEIVYFKRPWKWASDGLFVVAKGADGSVHESTPMIGDIDGEYLCTYFKPLASGDSYSFQEKVHIGLKPPVDPSAPGFDESKVELALLPHLELKPGRYKLRWSYAPRLYDDEQKCLSAGAKIWAGGASSPEIDLQVVD